MPIPSSIKGLHCISCPSHCEVRPNPSLREPLCDMRVFCSWPEENCFFATGIKEGILAGNLHHIYKGCIFVDFSIPFIRLFMDPEWIYYLAESKLCIILVSDKYLRPLANYWLKKNEHIFMVVYHNDSLSAASQRISKSFYGMRNVKQRGETLSTLELNTLRLLIEGKKHSEVAIILDTDIRNIYASKQRAEKKIGISFNDMLILSQAV